MTGSGVDWRDIATLAMDKANAGDQVGDATSDGVEFPADKIAKL